ncbi:hypothetical protein [Acerihabitans sp.]|uniref:hypothetical protein n=1 Tax=Acerihabitans sp. TaxID=2811394 RepID=UPI002EDAC47B
MNNVSIPKFGIQALTYRILDRWKTVNGLVNRISGGSINRDVLARKIISNTLSLGQEYIVTNQMLGKRSAEIVSLGRSVLFDNTLHQVNDGIAPLVELILQSKGQGALAQKLASGIAQCIGPVLLQDHALERVLVALTEQRGGENVLKMALYNALAGYTGGKIISAIFMSALKRAILDRLEYKPTSPLHHVVAWKLHQSLTTDPGSLPPPPAGVGSLDILMENTPDIVTGICRKLDYLQTLLGMPYSETNLSKVFPECWPSDISVAKDMSNKDFAAVVIKAYATGYGSVLDKEIAALPAGPRASFQQQCQNIRKFLSRFSAQDISVAQDWLGGLVSVSVNYAKTYAPSPMLVDFVTNRFRAPVHHPQEIDAYFADGAFVNALRTGIDLKVDNSQQSYVRWAAEMGNQFISQAKNIRDNQPRLTHAQQRQLGQLSEIVDHNPMSLMALTRYLVPESIAQSVQEEVFSQFTRRRPDLILADNIWMQVKQPNVSFVVSKDNGVNIDITLKWPISALGKAVDALETSESNQGHIISTVKVQLSLNDKGVEKQKISISDTRIFLKGTMTFEPPKKVEMDSPITFLSRGVLKQASDMVSSC